MKFIKGAEFYVLSYYIRVKILTQLFVLMLTDLNVVY